MSEFPIRSPLLLAWMEHLAELGGWLSRLGPLGLFAIAFLDSAFVPLPSGPDLAVIALSAVDPGRMLLFAFLAALGSLLGCLVAYAAARKAGVRTLERIRASRRQRIERLLERYGVLTMVTVSILPPPCPFKPFVLSAGVFRMEPSRFAAAIFFGRGVRFMIEGWLAVRFGERAQAVITRYGMEILIAVVVLVLAWGLWNRLRKGQDHRTE